MRARSLALSEPTLELETLLNSDAGMLAAERTPHPDERFTDETLWDYCCWVLYNAPERCDWACVLVRRAMR